MPTVPTQGLNISSGARMRGGSVAMPQLPRNSTLLNTQISRQVQRGPNAQAPFAGSEFDQGRAVGDALNKMGAAFALVADKVQEDLDIAAVTEADNKLSDAIRNSLMNPETGYLTSVGRGSIQSRTPTVNTISKAQREIEDSLSSDQQKARFRQVAGKRVNSAMDKIDQHALSQVQVYKVAESKARIEAARTDAAANWGSWRERDADGKRMGAYNLHKDLMLREVEHQVQANGFLPGTQGYRDMVLNEMLAQTTSLHSEVVQNMVSFGQTVEAREYFDQAIKNGEVHPDALDQVNNLIKTGSVKNDSLSLSFSLQGSTSEKKKELDKLFRQDKIDAELYDATMTRVKAQDAEIKAREAEYEKDVLTQAEAWLVENPGNTWVDIPARIQQGLKNTGQLDKIVSFSNNGGYKHNMDHWMAFLSLPESEKRAMDPTAFYNTYRDKFDDAHMEKGAAMVGPRSGKDQNQNKLITISERVKRAAQANNILPYDGKANKSQQQAFGRLEEEVQNRLNEFTQNSDRDPSPDEMQSIIDGVLLDEVMVPKSWGSDKAQSVYTVDPEKLHSVYVEVDDKEVKMSEIPPDKMAEYTQIILDRGHDVTQELLARMWLIDQE